MFSKVRWACLACVLTAVLQGVVSAELYISEFMASNRAGLLDEDGDSSDWMEIHNSGGATVQLSGYSLTDDPAHAASWIFPYRELGAGEYLVVFASGKNRSPAPTGELHTNFRLSKSGEYLALLDIDGSSALDNFSPAYPEQQNSVSCGRSVPGGEIEFYPVRTPGAANTNAVSGIYAQPESRGEDWERPASVEWMDKNGMTVFQESCGLRIHGNYFRNRNTNQKHSFRLLFKDEYGAGRLEEPLFKKEYPAAARSFNTLVLRAGANDAYGWLDAGPPQFIRDEFGRALLRDLGGGPRMAHLCISM